MFIKQMAFFAELKYVQVYYNCKYFLKKMSKLYLQNIFFQWQSNFVLLIKNYINIFWLFAISYTNTVRTIAVYTYYGVTRNIALTNVLSICKMKWLRQWAKSLSSLNNILIDSVRENCTKYTQVRFKW